MNIQAGGTFWTNPLKVYSWPQNQVFLGMAGNTIRWPLTFLGWDSAWYLNIMTKGYSASPQSYSFSPALPFTSIIINYFLQNPMVSLTIVSLVFGILWIPLYQILAETYMSRKSALMSALLIAFSPYIFVFTTVGYSEGMMLFFVLGAWVFLKKEKMVGSSAMAAIAPLARSMGILVVLPMLYASLKSKTHRTRNILLSLIPIASFSAWFVSLGSTSGDVLAPVHTTEWTQFWSVFTLFSEAIPHYGIKSLLTAPNQVTPITFNWLLPFASVLALILPLLLFLKLWKTDKTLWLYAAAGYIGILFFGAIISTPRFVSAIFPFWILLSLSLPLNKKSIVLTTIVILVFYVISLNLWSSFLSGEFIS